MELKSATAQPALDPLPQRYQTDAPGVGGVIKLRAEDFLVEEQPLYEPCGEGEHLYLCIEKSDVAHAELMSVLRRHFRVRESAIGFAGMKDKRAVTRQIVSVHLPGREATIEIDHRRIRVHWADRHRNKLRLGHLAGNRFSIRIRQVDPFRVMQVRQVLQHLEREGVPNYFGYQRFGYRRNNHLIGAAILRNDWQEAVDELLGSRGSPAPEFQTERRKLYDEGRYAEAAALWTPADRAELMACRFLAAGKSPATACRSIGKRAVGFWISAVQSFVFNRVLDARLDAGTLDQLLPGDLAWKHDSRATFQITQAEIDSGQLQPRLDAFEISPSGPLWGGGMRRASGDVDRAEALPLSLLGLEAPHFEVRGVEGHRRALRVRISNVEIDSGADEHGPYIRTAFDLPRGAYATVVLREIMKVESLEADDDA